MNEEFVGLVIAMREAQRNYFELATHLDGCTRAHQLRRALQAAKAAEQKVDAWIQQYLAERVQLEIWTRGVKGSESPAAYNVAREEDLAEHG